MISVIKRKIFTWPGTWPNVQTKKENQNLKTQTTKKRKNTYACNTRIKYCTA